ncbi:hypothetical protein [Bdellovibrio sp. HCB337]|uniref:hypothetical protein n=1 Tax=Bdellovibrio sp. HCB337 TaxID=3394358 RepID=UPI0039A6507E
MKLNKLFLGLIMSSWLANSAHAVPLLGETAGSIKVSGNVTLYRDHADPNKVYYFPNSTRFSIDNNKVPLFNFVYWGLDNPATGGAYMTMTTHLSSDEAQKKDLENFMATNPTIEVAVLPVMSSSVGLQTTATNQQPLSGLFTEFNFALHGGRAEDEIGVNAVLTGTGAKAFKALLTKSSSSALLKMDYCYKVQGYGPNMDAKITAKMDRVYEYFQTSHSGGWGWFSWSIQAVVEKLVAERSIIIEMNGGDAKDWEYIRTISETLTARLFVPELSATPITVAAPANRLFRFGGGYVRKEELQTETWTWKRRDLVERDFCTNIMIKDLEPYRDRLVISAD